MFTYKAFFSDRYLWNIRKSAILSSAWQTRNKDDKQHQKKLSLNSCVSETSRYRVRRVLSSA